MTKVRIRHGDTETTVNNPEFVDTLANVGEVAVDGRVFKDVTQVTFNNE